MIWIALSVAAMAAMATCACVVLISGLRADARRIKGSLGAVQAWLEKMAGDLEPVGLKALADDVRPIAGQLKAALAAMPGRISEGLAAPVVAIRGSTAELLNVSADLRALPDQLAAQMRPAVADLRAALAGVAESTAAARTVEAAAGELRPLLADLRLQADKAAAADAQRHDLVGRFVDEGIALAESFSARSRKAAGAPLGSHDKQTEALAWARERCLEHKIDMSDADLRKRIEIRLWEAKSK